MSILLDSKPLDCKECALENVLRKSTSLIHICPIECPIGQQKLFNQNRSVRLGFDVHAMHSLPPKALMQPEGSWLVLGNLFLEMPGELRALRNDYTGFAWQKSHTREADIERMGLSVALVSQVWP